MGRDWGRACLDLLFPPHCLGCRVPLPTSRPPLFCSACQAGLVLLTAPLCTCCGRPLGQLPGAPPASGHRCGACLQSPPGFSKARAAVLYDDTVGRALQTYKYHGDLAPLATFAELCRQAPAVAELVTGDYILPVPLHPSRLRRRGFNQALLLAQALFPERRRQIKSRLLVRHRPTRSQAGMSGRHRRLNLRGAFALTEPRLVVKRRILLVDDVFTTGSTVNECAGVLLAAGAAEVQVLTLARVRE
ncbi:MAG: ComF family protein [Desulfurivibrio sp.]|nr:ComF family protein [Desulfurivibrio sp.]